MAKSDEYRAKAEVCRRMAEATSTPQDKATWLKLAAGWLALIHTRNQLALERLELGNGRSSGLGATPGDQNSSDIVCVGACRAAANLASLRLSSLSVANRQTLELWIASTTASVTSLVVAVPPTSGVRMPAPVTFSTARISRAEASASPR